MPCPVEAGVTKEPYVDHHGNSSREIIVTALCSCLLFQTLGESDAMTDAVSVILAQLHTVEIAARSQIDLACCLAGHQLGDCELVCMDAMVEERRLFRRGTAGDSRPPQGGSVSFEARAHPQHDQIAPPDYAVGRSPYNCIDAGAGTNHCVE